MRALGICLVALAGLAGCGDDAVDPCPTGSCTLPGNTVVKFKFNSYPELGFESDTCSELQVANVRVEVIGVEMPEVYDARETSCPEGQTTFSGLPVQNYSVAVTPLDVDGNPLINTALPGRGMVAGAGDGARTETTVNVQYESWTRAYTGQLLYKLTWGGQSCAMATPTPVGKQQLTLTAGGAVTTLVNNRGDKLDGSAMYDCWPSTMSPQTVANLPWGPATLLVVGYDAAGTTELYRKEFPTFIGAGNFNPTLTFDVPPPI